VRLNRAPNGKFIGSGDVIICWLPVMLDCLYHSHIQDMLQIALRWTLKRAWMELKHGSEQLADESGILTYESRKYTAAWAVTRYAQWMATTEILKAAKAQVDEVWK
jgi:hypothetical protein